MQAREKEPQISKIDLNLYEAIRGDNLEQVRQAISASANTNAKINHETPLMAAAGLSIDSKNKIAIIKELLINQADPNAHGYTSYFTPLQILAEQRDVESFNVLIPHLDKKNFASKFMSPSNDKYPWYLYMMFHTPSVEILAILKANGADFNQMEGYCCHDTLLARDFQWDALVKMLLRDKTGFLGVNDICKMARFLIDNGFDLNARNGRGKYPLHMLIRLIDNTTENELDKVYDILDYYLTHGANVNVYDYDKNTPLHLAVRHGLPRVVQVLLKHGADQSARNFNELTPLEVSKSIQAEQNMSHPNAHVYLAKVNETHGKIQQALSGATLENRQVSELVRQRSSLHAAQPQVDTKEEKLASTSFQFG